MSAKRSRFGRSSSSSGFNNCDWLGNIEPPRVTPKPKPEPAPVPKPVQKQTKPTPVPNPVQKQTKPVVRPCIFTVELPEESRERKDDVGEDFYTVCSHCKREISKDKNVYMYGYLQAFCTLECREVRIEMVEKNRKPSPLRSRPSKEPVKPAIVSQVKKKCTVP